MAYEGMAETGSPTEVVVDDVGISFSVGTVGGFAYHLLKGLSCNFNFRRAFRLACHKGPQVGGVGAGFAAASDAVQIADVKIRETNDVYTIFFSNALGAAAVRAKHGIRSASLSALCVGTGLTALMVWLDLQRKKEDKLKYVDANNLFADSDSH